MQSRQRGRRFFVGVGKSLVPPHRGLIPFHPPHPSGFADARLQDGLNNFAPCGGSPNSGRDEQAEGRRFFCCGE
jgi:hypothetical protein